MSDLTPREYQIAEQASLGIEDLTDENNLELFDQADAVLALRGSVGKRAAASLAPSDELPRSRTNRSDVYSNLPCQSRWARSATATRTLLAGVVNSIGTVVVDAFEVVVELEGSQPDRSFLVFQRRGLKPEDRWVTHLVAESTGSASEVVRVLAEAVAAEALPAHVGTGTLTPAGGTHATQGVRSA